MDMMHVFTFTNLSGLAIFQVTLPKLHPEVVLIIDLQHFQRRTESALYAVLSVHGMPLCSCINAAVIECLLLLQVQGPWDKLN